MIAFWQRVFTVDLRSLALFRIALGLTLLLDVVLRLPDFEFFLTDRGPVPLQALVEDSLTGQTGFSLYFLSSYAFWPYFLLLMTALLAVALTLGWRTRAICPWLWLLSLSLQSRAPMALNSSDRLLLSFLFFGCFLPWDRLWTVGGPRRLDPPLYRVYHPAAAAVAGQLIVMYLMAFQFKLGPLWIKSGSALALTLMSAQYARTSWPLQFPELCRFATYSVVVWEAIGPFLLLATKPWLRTFAILVFASFHIGTGLLLDIGLFPVVCLLGLLAWLPSAVWKEPASPLVDVPPTSRSARLAIAAGFSLIVLGNVGSVVSSRFAQSPLRSLCALTGFEQRWALFAPSPRLSDVWYVALAEYKDGSKKDLLHSDREVDVLFTKPTSLRTESHRRRQYLIAMEHTARVGLRTWLAYYLYRTEVESSAPGSLVRVVVYQCVQENKPGSRPTITTFSQWPLPAAAP